MNPAEHEYDECCRAGNPAAYVAGLNDPELRALCGYAEAMMRATETKGGIPAIIKWTCVIEAAKRFLKP